MAEIITMPRLSDTMTEGKVAAWKKNVGDKINEGDILAEIETDKAVQDFESEYSGTLLYQGVKEGGSAPLDSILAIVGKAGEDISSLINKKNNTDNTKEDPKKEDPKQEKINTSKEIPSPTLPKNVEIVTMPRLSDTMTEGKVAAWKKNIGDKINEGDILAEIETDKAVQDFESEYSGTLLYQGVKEGGSAPLDSILAIVGPNGTDIQSILTHFNTKKNIEKVSENKAENIQPTQDTQISINTGNGSNDRIFASPLAKKIAKEKGIDLSAIKGSGENGRITKSDVENYTPSKENQTSKSVTSTASPTTQKISNITTGADIEIPNSQMRNIIAKRLSDSKNTAPHYYLFTEVNMDSIISLRQKINDLPNTKVSFNDMVIKVVALALREHPLINSSWGDNKIIQYGNINIGVAVAIEDGLVVPVLANADYMSIKQISANVKDLASRARERKLKANEMEGSTFSISNLGMFGIESFTSIINQPNSCILSIGAIIQKPIVKEGEIMIGNTMKISLACDHRVVDGASGAAFLQTLKLYIENPLAML